MGLPPLGDVKRRRTATYRVVEAAAPLQWLWPTRRSARVKQPSLRIWAHVDAILVAGRLRRRRRRARLGRTSGGRTAPRVDCLCRQGHGHSECGGTSSERTAARCR
jgi:hypothetical protein